MLLTRSLETPVDSENLTTCYPFSFFKIMASAEERVLLFSIKINNIIEILINSKIEFTDYEQTGYIVVNCQKIHFV